MALNIVLGDGEMDSRELRQTLDALWAAAEDEQFWFIVQGKSEPTATDTALVNWLNKSSDTKSAVYFEVVTDDESTPADLYENAQKVHTTKRLSQKVVSLLKTSPEDDEGAQVLALFYDTANVEAEEDRWLNDIIAATVAAGFKSFAMNDGMDEIEVGAAAPEEAAAPTKKQGVSKAAAAAKRVVENLPGGKAKVATVYSEDELAELTLDELKAIAAGKDITLPARSRTATYITAILDAQQDEAAEIVGEPEEVEDEGPFDVRAEANGVVLVVIHLPGQIVTKWATRELAEALLEQ